MHKNCSWKWTETKLRKFVVNSYCQGENRIVYACKVSCQPAIVGPHGQKGIKSVMENLAGSLFLASHSQSKEAVPLPGYCLDFMEE